MFNVFTFFAAEATNKVTSSAENIETTYEYKDIYNWVNTSNLQTWDNFNILYSPSYSKAPFTPGICVPGDPIISGQR